MPGYFSFQKLITPRFVKLIYVVGLMAMFIVLSCSEYGAPKCNVSQTRVSALEPM